VTDWSSLQVGHDLFQMSKDTDEVRMLENLDSNVTIVAKSRAPFIRVVPTMCLHDKKFVIVSGGSPYSSDCRRVDSFDLQRNRWGRLPDLNVGRYMAQCVSIKDKLFVFFGYTFTAFLSKRKLENSVEILGIENGELRWSRVEFSASRIEFPLIPTQEF